MYIIQWKPFFCFILTWILSTFRYKLGCFGIRTTWKSRHDVWGSNVTQSRRFNILLWLVRFLQKLFTLGTFRFILRVMEPFLWFHRKYNFRDPWLPVWYWQNTQMYCLFVFCDEKGSCTQFVSNFSTTSYRFFKCYLLFSDTSK